MRQSLLALACVLFLGCGDQVIFNFLPPEEQPVDLNPVSMSQPLFTAISVPDGLYTRCKSAPSFFCDGYFDSIYGVRFFVNAAGDTDGNDQYAIVIDPDGAGPTPIWNCTANNASQTSSQLEQVLVANINTSDFGCNVIGIATARFGSIYVLPLLETVTFATNVVVGPGGNGGSMSSTAVIAEDSDALPGFFDTVVTPGAQDVVNCNLGMKPAAFAAGDCAEAVLVLNEEGNTDFDRIGTEQAAGCTNFAMGGAIRVTTELQGSVTSAGALAASAGYVLRDTIAFENCRFVTDIGVGGGSSATTITFTGEIVRTTTHVPIPSAEVPATVTLVGTLGIDGDVDGNAETTGDPIWDDGIDFDASQIDDGSMTSYEGGACLGGTLNAGADDCEAGGVFSESALWFP